MAKREMSQCFGIMKVMLCEMNAQRFLRVMSRSKMWIKRENIFFKVSMPTEYTLVALVMAVILLLHYHQFTSIRALCIDYKRRAASSNTQAKKGAVSGEEIRCSRCSNSVPILAVPMESMGTLFINELVLMIQGRERSRLVGRRGSYPISPCMTKDGKQYRTSSVILVTCKLCYYYLMLYFVYRMDWTA